MKAHYYDLSIRVLIYKEDDQFVAHALELDIPAYGNSESEAKKELKDLVASQLSFASCIGKPEIINFLAPKEFLDRWEKANQAQLSGEPISEKSLGLRGKASVFVYSREDLTKLRTSGKRAFKAADHQDLVAAA